MVEIMLTTVHGQRFIQARPNSRIDKDFLDYQGFSRKPRNTLQC